MSLYPSTGYNRAGSLSLKSNMPMDYSRAVLSNKWHLKREAEPRDFELWSGNKPSLHQSTYKILGKNIDDERVSGITETRFKHEEALQLLAELRDQNPTKPMIDLGNKARLEANLEAYNNSPVLPSHKKGHDQHHLETTYNKDFVHPYPEIENQKSQSTLKKEFENSVDNSWAHRRMVSQFTDIDSPKRSGINTFHIQHGEYPNQLVKHQFLGKSHNNLFG